MPPLFLLTVVAGAVLLVGLIAAFLYWSVRARRGEENFIQAPIRVKPYEQAPIAPPAFERPETAPAAQTGEGESPVRNILQKVIPNLSSLIELSKRVEAAGAAEDTPEAKQAAIRNELQEMLAAHPENTMLRQLVEKLNPESGRLVEISAADKSATPAAGTGESGLTSLLGQIFTPEFHADLQEAGKSLVEQFGVSTRTRIKIDRVAGRFVVSIDGVECTSPEEISDPALREQARKILALLNKRTGS
jgi:hypothetical protein